MRLSIAALLVSCAPSLGLALIGNTWSFSSIPASGLNDISFGFNIANAPHKSGYYFAQQYRFFNVDNVAYTGIQPRPDSNGKSIVHGVFSTFQGGSTTSHPNCHLGADGGGGVSCAVEIEGDYSHTYNFVVESVGGTAWRGTMVDTVTNTSTVVGEWSLPAGAGKIRSSELGFVEYYPWNSGPYECKDLPFTEVTFYNPSSQTAGASDGAIGDIYEYGGCENQVDFSYTPVPNGFHIKVGFE